MTTQKIIKKEIFDKELGLCRMLSKDDSCNWGKCQDCGVIPLLYKLHKGVLLEDSKKIKKVKDKILLNA
jgi:hypothetical protein